MIVIALTVPSTAYTPIRLVPEKSAVLRQMQAVTAVTVNMLIQQLLTMPKKQKHQKAMSLTKLYIHL